MNYNAFKNSYQNTPVINISSLEGVDAGFHSLRDNINKWTKKGYIYRLKNNLYTLNENDRKTGVSRFFIANYIYTPSYVSLEYAMYHYGLIPENVYEITSVTTRKTGMFKNYFGAFSYSNVKLDLFFGYTAFKDENDMRAVIATPEKALLDFIYLRFCRRKSQGAIEGFIAKNRVQNLKILNRKKYNEYVLKYPERHREVLRMAFTRGGK
jgi:predicted transcriptional regulator of viral defense system